jgi:hypothetical protein
MGLRFGILVFPRIQQLDLTGPYEVFASAKGAEVKLVWKNREPVESSTGLTLIPTMSFNDCPDLDVLCVPGGAGINPLLLDETVLAFIHRYARGLWFSVQRACSMAGEPPHIGTPLIFWLTSEPFLSTNVLFKIKTS